MVKFPGVAKRVRQEGHQIGNHTYNHLKGRRYKVADYMANVHKADELMNGSFECLACGFGVGLAWGSMRYWTDHLKAVVMCEYEY